MRRSVLLIAALAVFGLLAAACSSDSSETEAATASTVATTEAPDEVLEPAPTATLPYELPDYSAEALAAGFQGTDFEIPEEQPDAPIGAIGFSRFVYTQTPNGDIVPTFVEGPPGRQTRCQDADQDCSYQELKALYDSGAEPPEYLGMDRDTLGEMVGQLDSVNAFVNSFESIDDACARGFNPTTNQTANMGIHMLQGQLTSEFDPDNPKMVLFAREDSTFSGSDIGDCVDGAWTGEDDYTAVGAVFNVPLTDEHPEGFAGDIDNWHIHYNTCLAPTSGSDSVGTEQDCKDAGGAFVPFIPSWMMHAYVADGFEAQTGVFSMFNPAVWPVVEPTDLRARSDQQIEGAVNAPILNFDYGDIAAAPGEPIVFSNSDAVPHTVTSGSALDPTSDFDSGVLGTGQSFELSFDEAGEYPLFCVLHPDMQATVVVS
ncbi:MAG: cupredoxin domain-containing protein [Acidimicrobiales bacterium]